MRSRIAVLIPVYDNWLGLVVSLRSLAQQSFACDVLVVDDGSSTPISESACRREKASTRVLRQSPNAGIVAALNLGLRTLLSDGYEYIARLDAGDRCMPDRLETQVRFLDDYTDVMLLGSHTAFETVDGTIAHIQRGPHDPGEIRRKMHMNSCFAHPAVMIRAGVLLDVGMYAPHDECAEDYGLFFRIAERFAAANVPKVLTVSQLNGNGISLSRRKQQLKSRLRIQMKHFRFGILESYLGVVKTLMLMITPTKATQIVKQRLYRLTSEAEVR